MVLVAADLVSDAVVADINQDVKIGTADGFVDLSFCFAGTETRALAVNQKRILGISGKGNPVAALGELFTELNQIRINKPFTSYLYHLGKGRVKQKTKESLLFVQVVVIIMDECPEGMQKKHAFYWAKRSYKEVNGKAKT